MNERTEPMLYSFSAGRVEVDLSSLRRLLSEGYGWAFSNLEGADLSGLDLRARDFRHANLRGVNFRDSNLEGCYFTNADTLLADFTNAGLTDASFTGATARPGEYQVWVDSQRKSYGTGLAR